MTKDQKIIKGKVGLLECQRRRKNASIFRNKNTSVKLARRAGNLGPFPRGSGLRPFIRRGVGTGAA